MRQRTAENGRERRSATFFTTEHTEKERRATEYDHFLGELRVRREAVGGAMSLRKAGQYSVALWQFSVDSVVEKASVEYDRLRQSTTEYGSDSFLMVYLPSKHP